MAKTTLGATIHYWQNRVAKLEAALKPFADFADARKTVPTDYVITEGSRLAKHQLTMGDCYAALDALKEDG